MIAALAAGICLIPAEPLLAGSGQATPVKMSASFDCNEFEIQITFTIANVGKEILDITDFHLLLAAVGPDGPTPLGFLHITPAPEFDKISPGEEATFLLPFSREGEPEDAEYRRLVVGAEILFEGRDKPVIRHFTFAPCSTPAAPPPPPEP